MSYCRFGYGGSEVYVFENTPDRFVCCECSLTTLTPQDINTIVTGRQAMLKHLLVHRKAGHNVPDEALDRLRREIKESGEKKPGCPGKARR